MDYFTTRLRAVLLVTCVLAFASIATAQPLRTLFFEEFLAQRFSTGPATWDSQAFCPTETSLVASRVLESYGAIFTAADTVTVPEVCVFKGEAQVNKFQKQLETEVVHFSMPISLQTAAARSLQSAVSEITLSSLRITPLDGAIAGSRTYGDTLMLWNSRVFPALAYWNRKGRLTAEDLDQFTRMELDAKIERILEWEARGIYFSTDRSRSILTSTAPPGSSQHLSFLAFDIVEYWNPNVRAILNKNGWYQTVVDDPPHFTYLGFPESELPSRGLKMVYKAGHSFWVPNLAPKLTN